MLKGKRRNVSLKHSCEKLGNTSSKYSGQVFQLWLTEFPVDLWCMAGSPGVSHSWIEQSGCPLPKFLQQIPLLPIYSASVFSLLFTVAHAISSHNQLHKIPVVMLFLENGHGGNVYLNTNVQKTSGKSVACD